MPLTRAMLERASRLDPVDVRSLDAIHLCTAVDLHSAGSIAAVLTYDQQLQADVSTTGTGSASKRQWSDKTVQPAVQHRPDRP